MGLIILCMSKLPDVFEFQFDPKTSKGAVFQDRVGFVLWTCIKSGHIVSQYFNDDVMLVSQRVKTEKPDSYYAFKKIIEVSPLSSFGRFNYLISLNESINELDQQFWAIVWRYVRSPSSMKIKVENPA